MPGAPVGAWWNRASIPVQTPPTNRRLFVVSPTMAQAFGRTAGAGTFVTPPSGEKVIRLMLLGHGQ